MKKSLDQIMKEKGYLKGGETVSRERYPELFKVVMDAALELKLPEKMINIPWIKKISKSIPKTRFCCKTDHYDVVAVRLHTRIKKWVYYYNDGDIEIVTMRIKL